MRVPMRRTLVGLVLAMLAGACAGADDVSIDPLGDEPDGDVLSSCEPAGDQQTTTLVEAGDELPPVDVMVRQVGPQQLAVDVPSRHGDPELDGLVEADDEVRVRIVTTMVVSGDAPACLDEVRFTLQDPLGDRDVIDAESGESLRVVELHPDPDGD